MFLQAIYSIFNKKSECQFKILNDERDYIWFALKTFSKASRTTFTFYHLQKEIEDRYDKNPSEQNYVNLALVLSFHKLTQPNPHFDADDSMHFLLFLHLLFSDKNNTFWKQNARAEFYKKIMSNSRVMISKDLSLALDYIIITIDNDHNPIASVLKMISDLLVTSQSI